MSESRHEGNGAATKEPARRGKRKTKGPGEAPPPATNPNDQQKAIAAAVAAGGFDLSKLPGVWKADLDKTPSTCLVPGWVVRGAVTLLVGPTEVGKGAFLAMAARHAGMSVWLPGHEESQKTLYERLELEGIGDTQVRILGKGDWRLPKREEELLEVVQALKADFLAIDPARSYLPEGYDENSNPAVREFLESCHRIAERAGCAVVGAHHPSSQDTRKWCKGASEWRDTPRVVLRLAKVKEEPPAYTITAMKFSASGGRPLPTMYELVGDAKGVKRFVFKGPVDPRMQEFAKDVDERRLFFPGDDN